MDVGSFVSNSVVVFVVSVTLVDASVEDFLWPDFDIASVVEASSWVLVEESLVASVELLVKSASVVEVCSSVVLLASVVKVFDSTVDDGSVVDSLELTVDMDSVVVDSFVVVVGNFSVEVAVEDSDSVEVDGAIVTAAFSVFDVGSEELLVVISFVEAISVVLSSDACWDSELSVVVSVCWSDSVDTGSWVVLDALEVSVDASSEVAVDASVDELLVDGADEVVLAAGSVVVGSEVDNATVVGADVSEEVIVVVSVEIGNLLLPGSVTKVVVASVEIADVISVGATVDRLLCDPDTCTDSVVVVDNCSIGATVLVTEGFVVEVKLGFAGVTDVDKVEVMDDVFGIPELVSSETLGADCEVVVVSAIGVTGGVITDGVPLVTDICAGAIVGAGARGLVAPLLDVVDTPNVEAVVVTWGGATGIADVGVVVLSWAETADGSGADAAVLTCADIAGAFDAGAAMVADIDAPGAGTSFIEAAFRDAIMGAGAEPISSLSNVCKCWSLFSL